MITMFQLLRTAIKEQASDLHILADSPPVMRIQGFISRVKHNYLKPEETKQLCYSVISENQKAEFENKRTLDFSFSLGNEYRFRGHLFYQKGSVAGSFRLIPEQVPPLNSLGLPQHIDMISRYPYGIVLVTGPTGSGKSTTLAAVIKEINARRKGHIVTIEDPIEYVHSHDKCIITQKELGYDILSFSDGLRAALREDPDVCLVGEMRDKETIISALHTAETGHLVFSTLHTNTSFDAIERIIGVFNGDEKAMIRNQLSNTIKAVICQRLLPTLDGKRILCYEILFATTGIRNLIREGKQHQIYSQMQTQTEEGMVTFNQCLHRLVRENTIAIETAMEASPLPKELDTLISCSIVSQATG